MGELLNRLRTGVTEFWKGLDKGQKTRILIAAALSIVLVAAFVIYVNNPKMDVLYTNLSKTDAGQIVGRLKELGVKYKLDGTTIYVPQDKVDTLQVQLATEGLQSDESTIPETTSPSFYETSEDKNQRYLTIKQEKLKKGIKSIKGVDYVDVQLYIPDDNTFVLNDSKTESSASLIIKMKPGAEPLDKNQVDGIIQYIAKSVKGLKPENISLMDENARSLVPDANNVNAVITTQMEMQNTVKDNIEKSIKKFLEAPFGTNNVEVRAAVKLDFNAEVDNSTTYTPVDTEKNTGIVRNMQEINKEWVDTGTGGVPGTDTNTDTIPQYPTTDGSNAKYSEASNVVNYEINELKKEITKEMGNIQALSISVIINQDGLKQDAQQDQQQLINNVKDLVKYSVQGFNVQPTIVDNSIDVKVMRFDTSLKDKIAEDQAKAAQKDRNNMIVMIATAAAAVLVFGAALFFFLRRRSGAAAGPQQIMPEEYITDANGNIISAGPSEALPVAEIELEDRNEVKKQIEKFVSQKPDTVAQLLKTWLNED